MNFPDRRKHPRVVLIAPVEIKSDSRVHQGLIRNISLSGLGLESFEILTVGKRYLFSFAPGGFSRVKVHGTVRWSADFENKKLYGVEFSRSEIFNRIKIALLIRRLSKTSK